MADQLVAFVCRALQRMVAGMLLAALAFVVAALLQVQIDVSLCVIV